MPALTRSCPTSCRQYRTLSARARTRGHAPYHHPRVLGRRKEIGHPSRPPAFMPERKRRAPTMSENRMEGSGAAAVGATARMRCNPATCRAAAPRASTLGGRPKAGRLRRHDAEGREMAGEAKGFADDTVSNARGMAQDYGAQAGQMATPGGRQPLRGWQPGYRQSQQAADYLNDRGAGGAAAGAARRRRGRVCLGAAHRKALRRASPSSNSSRQRPKSLWKPGASGEAGRRRGASCPTPRCGGGGPAPPPDAVAPGEVHPPGSASSASRSAA
jgi:hypothetical protein